MKNLIKQFLPKPIRRLITYFLALNPAVKRSCNICGFKGYFEHFAGPPLLNEVVCPKCGSHSWHRLFWDWYKEVEMPLIEPVYHFAPESVLENKFRGNFQKYVTSNITPTADCVLDIQNIDLPDSSIGTIICNHVLEHVPNDRQALKEFRRVLKPEGRLIVSVPLVEGWAHTYEDKGITSERDRAAHFGQCDHLRVYGHDFRSRLTEAGFSKVEEITAYGAKAVELGLLRGEKIFLCSGAAV